MIKDSPYIPEAYALAWHDEFTGSSLDADKWAYRTDRKMLSTQLEENVEVKDGQLILHVRKESRTGRCYTDKGIKPLETEYTGSGIVSKQAFKHGYYEARFKVPEGAGWHTSFWLMKHDGSGYTDTSAHEVADQEIDICEHDSVSPEMYTLNMNSWSGSHSRFGYKEVPTGDLRRDFHIWGCEYTEDAIRYYFEGELVQEIVDLDQHLSRGQGEHHIWLTVIASLMGKTEGVDDAHLPSVAVFDYVRHYAKA